MTFVDRENGVLESRQGIQKIVVNSSSRWVGYKIDSEGGIVDPVGQDYLGMEGVGIVSSHNLPHSVGVVVAVVVDMGHIEERLEGEWRDFVAFGKGVLLVVGGDWDGSLT